MFEKIKKFWIETLSWIIGGLGILATVICSVITEVDGFFLIYVSLLATESILVIIGTYSLKQKLDYENQLEHTKAELEELQAQLNAQYATNEEAKATYQKYVSTIITNLKNISKLNNDLCNRIPEVSEKSYRVLETLKASGSQDTDIFREEVKESYKDFANGLFDLYKRYSSHLLTNTVNMVEAYLKLQGYNHKVSATIKLFDNAYFECGGRREDVTVYTAFRDKGTYDGKKEREIGQIPYTIGGNVDFSMCLTKDHYVINNAKKGSESYFNEHMDFDAHYNCAVVVAIRVKLADNSYKYLGYLCCDCLNTDSQVDVFDKQVAQLLYSMAQYYATFLETLDSNWLDRGIEAANMPSSFINLIYNRTFKGKH